MIYIIIEYDLFEYGLICNDDEICRLFGNIDEIRRILKSDGMSFKTIKEAKDYRAIKPVFGNVKFYDVKKKKEVR